MTNNIYKIYVTSRDKWEELELDDFNLSTTFSIEEIKDISKRKDTISKSIVLKGTKVNNKVFGALYSLDREVSLDESITGNLLHNYKPNKYLKCFVLENNVEIIRGKLIVTSIDIRKGVIYYNCSIVGNVYSFFSEMNDRLLDELDYFNLPEFRDIVFDKQTIEDSWDTSENRPEFFFPMIDYGGSMGDLLWATNAFRWDVFRPAIYLDSYLKAIFRGFRVRPDGSVTQYQTDEDYSRSNLLNTFSLKGDFIEDPLQKRLFIPNNFTNLTKRVTGEWDEWDKVDVLFEASSLNSLLNINYGDYDGNNFRFKPFSVEVETHSAYIDVVNKQINNKITTVFRLKTDMVADLEIRAHLLIDGTASINDRFFVALAKDDNVSESDFIYSKSIAQREADDAPFFINDVVKDVHLKGDIVIGIYHPADAQGSNSVTFDIPLLNLRILTGSKSEAEVQYKDTFNVFDTIPRNISIREFLKNLLITFNLYITADEEDDSILYIYTHNEFYKHILNLDIESSKDWSDKVDWSSYSLSSNTSLPRGYKFSYKDDNDVMNKLYKSLWERTYGDRDILDSSGLTNILKVEPMFSPTINLKWNGDRDIPALFDGEFTFEGDKKQIQTNIRLLYFSGAINTSSSYVLSDSLGDRIREGGNLVRFDKYPFSSMNLYELEEVDDGIDISYVRGGIISSLLYESPMQVWGDDMLSPSEDEFTLYKRNYHNQIRELTNVNLITVEADVFLNEYDINTLDLRVPIFLQSPYGSSYFKVLRVDYYDSNSPSKVLLQKIVLPDTDIR